ncbi:hypothetical protein GCM10022220_31020 [Actinocatenispora rupis]|uniref:NfeD-like C-terminal, partner-binding n=1 Tax=Actinocatenispora rupis TaxID=519421 RepID=A0A8J3JC40_9ACTN|nr:hypothetical protein Aru02nite_41620 [Actinocatenispora rupis]
MDWVTITFLVVGAVGVVVLAASLLLGDLLHLGHADADGPFSVPAIAGFVGAFGFAGLIVASLVPGGVVVEAGAGMLGGLLAALPTGWLALRLTRAVADMPTDATLSSADLIGVTGVVITPIRTGGYGEVSLTVSGQRLKYNARADAPLATGTPVLVIETPSATSVVVEETAALPPELG